VPRQIEVADMLSSSPFLLVFYIVALVVIEVERIFRL